MIKKQEIYNLLEKIKYKDEVENMKTSEEIKVGGCSIVCNDHPEWGSFGVMDDRGNWFEIHGRGGRRVLSKKEADKFWNVVKN